MKMEKKLRKSSDEWVETACEQEKESFSKHTQQFVKIPLEFSTPILIKRVFSSVCWASFSIEMNISACMPFNECSIEESTFDSLDVYFSDSVP